MHSMDERRTRPIRVLIVDDSAVVRRVLTEELAKYPGIQVVGTASDPYVARERIAELRPDVLTLDVELPRMDGLTFLERLMRHFPMPVVVVSSLTPRNSAVAMRALSLGAVDVVRKPTDPAMIPAIGARLARAIHGAALADIGRIRPDSTPDGRPDPAAPLHLASNKVIAIGASTGGPHAIETILRALPPDVPGTVIVQHMPEFFTASFAERLDQVCPMHVREARDGDGVAPGVALIAPGNRHMILQQDGAGYRVRIKDGPPVHHQRPSVDVLFSSVARGAGPNAIGILLTGMGADGARGLLAMRESGAVTIAQDEETSVVYGMPREAVRLGAAMQVLPLPLIAPAVLRHLAEPARPDR